MTLNSPTDSIFCQGPHFSIINEYLKLKLITMVCHRLTIIHQQQKATSLKDLSSFHHISSSSGNFKGSHNFHVFLRLCNKLMSARLHFFKRFSYTPLEGLFSRLLITIIHRFHGLTYLTYLLGVQIIFEGFFVTEDLFRRNWYNAFYSKYCPSLATTFPHL